MEFQLNSSSNSIPRLTTLELTFLTRGILSGQAANLHHRRPSSLAENAFLKEDQSDSQPFHWVMALPNNPLIWYDYNHAVAYSCDQ